MNKTYINIFDATLLLVFVLLIPSLLVTSYIYIFEKIEHQNLLYQYSQIVENKLKIFQSKLKVEKYLQNEIQKITYSFSNKQNISDLSLTSIKRNLLQSYKNKIGDYPLAFAIVDFDTKDVISFLHPEFILLPNEKDKGKRKFEDTTKLYFLDYYINRNSREKIINTVKILDKNFNELLGWGVSTLGLSHDVSTFCSKFLNKGVCYWFIQTVHNINQPNPNYPKFGLLVVYNESQINCKKLIKNAVDSIRAFYLNEIIKCSIYLKNSQNIGQLPKLEVNKSKNEISLMDLLESKFLILKLINKRNSKLKHNYIPVVEIKVILPKFYYVYNTFKSIFTNFILLFAGIYALGLLKCIINFEPFFKTLINNIRFAVINILFPYIVLLLVLFFLFVNIYKSEFPEIVYDKLSQKQEKIELQIKNYWVDENIKLLRLYPLLCKYQSLNFDKKIESVINEKIKYLSLQNLYAVDYMGRMSNIHKQEKFQNYAEKYLKVAKCFAQSIFTQQKKFKLTSNNDEKVDSYMLLQTMAEEFISIDQFNNSLTKEYSLIRNFVGNERQWFILVPIKDYLSNENVALFFLSGSMKFIKDRILQQFSENEVLDIYENKFSIVPLFYSYSTLFDIELDKNVISHFANVDKWFKNFYLAEITRKEKIPKKIINYDDSNALVVTRSKLFNSDYLIGIHLAKEIIKQNSNKFLMYISFALFIGFAMFMSLLKIIPSLFTNQLRVFLKAIEYCSQGILNWEVRMLQNDEFSILAKNFNMMRTKLIERLNLLRFVPSDTLNYIEHTDNQICRYGKEILLTVLYSDIRNFTKLTEENSAEEIVAMLNEYFTFMERSIVSHGGVVINLIGDALLAYFPVNSEDDRGYKIKDIIKCALEMKEKLFLLNEKRKKIGLFTINNGIAIATDWGYYGILGSKYGRLSCQILGNVVNKAIYLESQTAKLTNYGIIIDDVTANIAKYSFNLKKIKLDENNLKLVYAYELLV